MAKKPQKTPPSPQGSAKFADGGAVGGQPTMAIGYADGGLTGPYSGNLNSNTTTFNQDWLRGPNFGERSTAGLVSYPTTGYAGAAPAPQQTSGGGGGTMPSPGPTRTDPLSSGEQSALSGVKGVMGMIGGPIGSLLGGAIDANQGYKSVAAGTTPTSFDTQSTAPNGFAGQIGVNMGQGMGLMDSVSAAARGRLGSMGALLDGSYNEDYGNEGRNALSQSGFQPATGVTVGAPMPSPNIETKEIAPTQAPDLSTTYTGPMSTGWDGSGATGGDYNGSASAMSRGGAGSSGEGTGAATGGNNGDASGGGDRGTRGGFADGGQITPMSSAAPSGPPGLQMPQQPGQTPTQMDGRMAAMHVQNTLANPQAMQLVKQHVMQALQSGKVSPQQLMMLAQLAQSALHSPELWPKLRLFAIQSGLAKENELPQQFSQGLCMTILAASQAAQHGDRPGAFADGGMLHGPGSGTSDSIHAQNHDTGQPVKLSNGEYIIPADVVRTKGREFFDNIVRKYHTPAALQNR